MNRRAILIPRVGHWMRLCRSLCLLPQPESHPSWEAQLNASLDLSNKALSIPSTVLSPSLNSVTPHCSHSVCFDFTLPPSCVTSHTFVHASALLRVIPRVWTYWVKGPYLHMKHPLVPWFVVTPASLRLGSPWLTQLLQLSSGSLSKAHRASPCF